MSGRTRGQRGQTTGSTSDSSFNTSASSLDGSRLLHPSDSFRSTRRSSGSYDDDDVDNVNVSDSNMTYLIDVEDLDASAELTRRDQLLGGDFSPRRRRKSPRLQERSSISEGSPVADSPSPRKQTRYEKLSRSNIHDRGRVQTSPLGQCSDRRAVGVKAAVDSQLRQTRRKHSQQQGQGHTGGIIPDTLPEWCWVCLMLAAAFVIVLVIKPMLVWHSEDHVVNPASVSDRETILHTFDAGFDGLRKYFPSQSVRFWRVVKAATRAVMKLESPPEPAVLLLAMTPGSKSTASCLVQRFAGLVTEAYQAKKELVLNASHTELEQGADVVKLFIDETLSRHLGRGSHVAVLHQLELLPGRAAMIFHGYCDNDNAPHKDAILVFTIELTVAPSVEEDYVVEDRLSELWSQDLEIDKYTALLSRMAKSVAFVRPESVDVIQKMCP